MAKIIPAAKPLVAATFKVGANNFEGGVSKVELAPTTPTAAFHAVDGTIINSVGAADWVLNVDGLQDYATTSWLSGFALTNHGTDVVCDVYPYGITGAGYRVTASIQAGAIGGETGTLQPVNSYSWACTKPVLI